MFPHRRWEAAATYLKCYSCWTENNNIYQHLMGRWCSPNTGKTVQKTQSNFLAYLPLPSLSRAQTNTHILSTPHFCLALPLLHLLCSANSRLDQVHTPYHCPVHKMPESQSFTARISYKKALSIFSTRDLQLLLKQKTPASGAVNWTRPASQEALPIEQRKIEVSVPAQLTSFIRNGPTVADDRPYAEPFKYPSCLQTTLASLSSQ